MKNRNFKTGMKIQMIDTVIDLYGDATTTFGESGSQDITEFLGRAGVSLAKAGATAALGSLFAAVVGGLVIIAGGLPVLVVLGLVVGGYVLAATVVDLTDQALQIKERVAAAAR